MTGQGGKSACEKVGFQGLARNLRGRTKEDKRRMAVAREKRERFALLVQQGLEEGSPVVYQGSSGLVEAIVYDLRGGILRIKQKNPPRYVYKVDPLRIELVD